MMRSPFNKPQRVKRSSSALFAYSFLKPAADPLPEKPQLRTFEIDTENVFGFAKEDFISDYSSCYFDPHFVDTLFDVTDVDFSALSAQGCVLDAKIDLSYQKMMANDQMSVKSSSEAVDEFIGYCQQRITLLEWMYYCLSRFDEKQAAKHEKNVSLEVMKVMIKLCKAFDEHSFFNESSAPLQKSLWRKIFFIFETLSSSVFLSNLDKMDQYCLKASTFLRRLITAYQFSGLPFDMIYAQQMMGETLQAVSRELDYDDSGKFIGIRNHALSDVYYNFSLVYFSGNEFEAGVNQLEKSIEFLVMAVENIMLHQNLMLSGLRINNINKTIEASEVKPGRPQIEELNSRLHASFLLLYKIKPTLLSAVMQCPAHLMPKLKVLKEILIAQESLLQQKKLQNDSELRSMTPDLVRMKILELETQEQKILVEQKTEEPQQIKTVRKPKKDIPKKLVRTEPQFFTPLPAVVVNPVSCNQPLLSESCYNIPTQHIADEESERDKREKAEKYFKNREVLISADEVIPEVKNNEATLFHPILLKNIKATLDVQACYDKKLSDQEVNKLLIVLANGRSVGAKGEGIKLVNRRELRNLGLYNPDEKKALWVKLKPLGKNGVGDLRVYGKLIEDEHGEFNVCFNLVSPKSHKTLERRPGAMRCP